MTSTVWRKGYLDLRLRRIESSSELGCLGER
jgi:hypothetical protein